MLDEKVLIVMHFAYGTVAFPNFYGLIRKKFVFYFYHPINNDLLKSYEKPLKEVQFVTDLTKLEVKSVNPNMAIPSDLTSLTGDFEVASTSAGFSSTDYSFASDYSQNDFSELENYFQDKNETLIGIIDYDFDKMQNRKINNITINPDQKKEINLDKGDRLITIANFNNLEMVNHSQWLHIL